MIPGDITIALWGGLLQTTWTGLRVSAFVATAPVLGGRTVPGRVRLLLAVVLTPILAAVLPPVATPEMFSSDWWLAVVFNVGVGLLLGTLLQLLFESLMLASELISATAGLSFAQVNDPLRGTASPVLGSLLMAFASLLFLALDGHHALIRVLAYSYAVVPVSGPYQAPPWMALLGLMVPMLEAGLSLALPVLASLLVVQLGFGLVSRAAPALNLFAIGLPAALLALLGLLWLWMPHVGTPLSIYWDQFFGAIHQALAAGAAP
ncbi:flagellar biosynthetic protein FliR [Flagellatimonas centrodinii]|uniref:flagellar biosynthetic protein FliR n=1 Tax=Flagellatimonas centrodinii TaxID=2806210 RepID=UPI001FED401C|nr:flagellar biosynthetic protein FliR [Flagellatimonas centrodinii]ULQ45652.1 flagellar biosynthetic protein FliR [Flagellatimonas centrodinii]